MLWWTFQNAIVTALMAAIVWLVARPLRLSPAARHALWLLVLLKFLHASSCRLALGNFKSISAFATATRANGSDIAAGDMDPDHGDAEVPRHCAFRPANGCRHSQRSRRLLHRHQHPCAALDAQPSPRSPSIDQPFPAPEFVPMDRSRGRLRLADRFELVALLHGIRILRMMALVRVRISGRKSRCNRSRCRGSDGRCPIECRVVSGIGSPAICSLLRPVLLWPADLQALSQDACLRWPFMSWLT